MLRKSLSFLLVFLTCACASESPSRPISAPAQVRQPTLVNEARGDVPAVVRAVVDGRTVELDTGERVEVSLLAQPADCWAAGARTFAEKWLLGKTVRVSALTPGEVNLRLDDGTDYASLAVREGVLRAQTAAGSLADAELGAAREDRGLWGAPCNGMDAAPTTTTTTTTAAPPAQRVEPQESKSTTTPPVVTTTPPPPPCAVVYRLDGQWQDGFQGKITIRNTGGAPINGWTLRWSFADGQSVRQMWNASVSQRGSAVTAAGVENTRSISPRGEVEIGFLGTFRGRNTAPTSFSLNGTACATS
ncbi:cellulose binding domain-containing protein [Lentzea flaviverrucosa]|uniref:Cellulose binding domain-containing protein n=1 Tax=Lentzea flaviverrucosa TaxID=200379 RepID=A0A1H9UW40_9PSEU|nr:cellulose binding domain-containing protein [Lentzea flaviverrucosa]SES13354.1 Cellulose binding domain-containing protein [Lentzea flaviverrucosa]